MHGLTPSFSIIAKLREGQFPALVISAVPTISPPPTPGQGLQLGGVTTPLLTVGIKHDHGVQDTASTLPIARSMDLTACSEASSSIPCTIHINSSWHPWQVRRCFVLEKVTSSACTKSLYIQIEIDEHYKISSRYTQFR